MIRVQILGNGNVAFHLQKLWAKDQSIQLFKSLTFSQIIKGDWQDLSKADIYVLCLRDQGVRKVSEEMPVHDSLVVHTSGSTSLQELSFKNRRGVLYPLQTFRKGQDIVRLDFPIGLEAENEQDLKLLQKLAHVITPNIHYWNSEERQRLHLAAVWANNFTNHLYTLVKRLCNENQLPFALLYPLMEETLKKAIKFDPEENQTGPAKRGDYDIINRHLGLLRHLRDKQIYQVLSESIKEFEDAKQEL